MEAPEWRLLLLQQRIVEVCHLPLQQKKEVHFLFGEMKSLPMGLVLLHAMDRHEGLAVLHPRRRWKGSSVFNSMEVEENVRVPREVVEEINHEAPLPLLN